MNTDTFRARHGLPTSDAALVYELLLDHDLGVPITTLAVFLEVHPTNLRRVWDVVHEVQDLYNVEIGKRGSSLPVIYLKNSHWGELQDLCYHRRLAKIRSGELVKVTSEKPKQPKPQRQRVHKKPRAPKPNKPLLNRRERLIEVIQERGTLITSEDVKEVLVCTRQNAVHSIKRWLSDGFIHLHSHLPNSKMQCYEIDADALEIEVLDEK